MSNIVPEKALDFTVYDESGELLGVAEATMPNVEFMTTEIKGAGIAGVIESPGIGETQSMTCELTWRNRTSDWQRLITPEAHVIDMYSAELGFDSGSGKYQTGSVHLFMRAFTKSYDMGKLVVKELTETKTVHEIYQLMLDIDGERVLEIDKYAFKYAVRGVDYYEEVRKALGKE